MKKIVIKDEYITLGQLLKFTGIIGSGAMAKSFILDNKIYVNGELETRRGRKLYESYVIEVNNQKYEIGK
jgi:ribosome-associated protein